MENGLVCKEEVVVFRTTTPRVVGVELNFSLLQLNFWLNGRTQPNRKKVITPGYWVPAIRILGIGNNFILNPFAQNPKTQMPFVIKLMK
jgi:hypothetical protein